MHDGTRPRSGAPVCVAAGNRPDNTSCGSTTYGPYGACGGFSGVCGTSGTKSRSRTRRLCASGTCNSVLDTQTTGCTRPSTDGNPCFRRATCADRCLGGTCSAGRVCTFPATYWCEPGICVPSGPVNCP